MGARLLMMILTGMLVLAVIELESFAFGELSRRRGNPYQFYRSDFFSRLDLDAIAQNRYRPIGWPRDRQPRSGPITYSRLCASAFGDSFTYGDAVEEHETWPYFLSVALHCEVGNFGYSAYGLDQAVLRYEQEQPGTSVVLLGLSGEMVRRGLAGSWSFYGGAAIQRQYGFPEYYYEKPFFVLSDDKLVEIPLPSEPVTHQTLERHGHVLI